jgi:hypothetical protein
MGCVRLTNWDAEELAGMVTIGGTEVQFLDAGVTIADVTGSGTAVSPPVAEIALPEGTTDQIATPDPAQPLSLPDLQAPATVAPTTPTVPAAAAPTPTAPTPVAPAATDPAAIPAAPDAAAPVTPDPLSDALSGALPEGFVVPPLEEAQP